jgi:pimeloyl-ACP methyl ester carboxylesterase
MATDQMRWLLPLKIVNGLGVGFYLDSLYVDVEDLDAGETGGPRTTSLALPRMARMAPALSAGDSVGFNYLGFAVSENARLTFHLRGHTSAGETHVAQASVEMLPGVISQQFPSHFLKHQGHKLELVLVSAVRATENAPGILLVHGHGSHARRLLGTAWDLANHGYTVMLVSQPGYGLSEGTADAMGRATVQAVGAALDRLRRTSGVDSTRIALWGVGTGANVAAQIAAGRSDLRGLIAHGGSYDLRALHREPTLPTALREQIERAVGSDSAAWRQRSPLLTVKRIRSPVLVVHDEHDAGLAQAQAFAAALRSNGRGAEARFIAGAAATVPTADVMLVAGEFLARQLKEQAADP